LVFLGLNQKTNQKVALKIYQKDKIKDLQRKKSIRREIKIMQRVNHPNIAKLFDVIETDTQVILVMEYINGGSTHGYLKSKPNRRMDEHNAKKIFSQLISAL
jgi:MAP/microtubule affinity-regulating kinase